MGPAVAVIIPVFNRRFELVRALRSLEKQIFRDFEVLICDDGSTDGSAGVVGEFSSSFPIRVFTQENSGRPASARNLGLREVRSKYVAFLDSDDWWDERKLSRSTEALECGADFVYHDMKRVIHDHAAANWRRVRSRKLSKNPHKSLLVRGNAIPTSSVVVRSSLVESVGFMNESESVRGFEDYEYWLRLAQVSNKFTRIRESLGYYSSDPTSHSSSVGLLWSTRAVQQHYFSYCKRFPAWIHFGLGVALFRGGDMRQARYHLMRSLFFHGLPRLWVEYPFAILLLFRSFLGSIRLVLRGLI